MDSVAIAPCGALDASVRPPGSKSLTNRALVCAALAEGTSRLTGALDSEDTRVMVEALEKLGLAITADRSTATIDVTGCSGRLPVTRAEVWVANSGTTIRFLTAMLAAAGGHYRLHGVPRMHQRPIGDLLAALSALGADCRAESPGGCPPVVVDAPGLRGGAAHVRGDISSQFLSGLLMAAPYAAEAVDLQVEGTLVSQPYVHMTLGVMRAFGLEVAGGDLRRLTIAAPRRYHGTAYDIEPDASAASYFWGAAAIAGGTVTVEGLSSQALQGDVAFVECLRAMGCDVVETPADETEGGRGLRPRRSPGITVTGRPLRGIDVDMNAISDTVQTLAVVALFAEGPTRIRGVAHNRHKETDRIGDLARELRKLGALVDEHDDGLTITPGPLRGATIETYHDHRMAMSLALAGLRVPGVVITNPGCTGKTYPRYFEDLARVCATAA